VKKTAVPAMRVEAVPTVEIPERARKHRTGGSGDMLSPVNIQKATKNRAGTVIDCSGAMFQGWRSGLQNLMGRFDSFASCKKKPCSSSDGRTGTPVTRSAGAAYRIGGANANPLSGINCSVKTNKTTQGD